MARGGQRGRLHQGLRPGQGCLLTPALMAGLAAPKERSQKREARETRPVALQGPGPQAARLRGQAPPRVAPVAEPLQGVCARVGSWLQGRPEAEGPGASPTPGRGSSVAPGPELGPQVCVTLASAHLARRGPAQRHQESLPRTEEPFATSKSTGFPEAEAELLRENARVLIVISQNVKDSNSNTAPGEGAHVPSETAAPHLQTPILPAPPAAEVPHPRSAHAPPC